MSTHCRIARVRPKASPQMTVHVLPEDGGLKGDFMQQCSVIQEMVEGPMTGYAVVAWGRDGTTTAQFRVGGPPYHQCQVPALTRDALLDHHIREIAG